jgi:plastocyanin
MTFGAEMKRLTVLLAALTGLATASFAATGFVITQKDKTFAPGEIEVKLGDSIKVTNEDPFLHHVYIESAEINYDSGEQPPGRTIEIRFDHAGTFEARCAIHPKMLLVVHVRP